MHSGSMTRPSDSEGVTPSRRADELNAEQRAAAEYGEGPLLIIAGAGTGKTRTLVHRVGALIDRGIPSQRILLLTFTRRAAQEMLSRAERLVGQASAKVQGGTFHGIGHRMLRMFGAAAGLAKDFTILDQGDAEDLMGIARARLGFAQRHTRFPKKETLHWVYSRHVNTEIPVEQILRQELSQFAELGEEFRRIFVDYTARKAERNLVDYDDLLLFWAVMLEQAPSLAERMASLYDYVLVDEYQDTNLLQARILRGLCRSHRNLTVVGDDAQSIYSFRGAEVRNILEFPQQFPGTQVVTLERNYRSTQAILDATNALIARAPRRYTKNLWTDRTGGEPPWLVTARDEHEQTTFVADRILEAHEAGTPLREMAVLFRAGYMSADLEIELTNRQIPFDKWGGLKFLEAAHVKDVLAFLRLLENPRDEVSWFRILLLLPGIGDGTARTVVDALAQRGWTSEALSDVTLPSRARESQAALAAMFRDLTEARSSGPLPIASEIAIMRRVYDDILRAKYDRPEPRLADLDQLEVISGNFPDRATFLADLALEPPSATHDLAGAGSDEQDTLILSTAHSAKGREWDAVFIIWAVDGWFPMSRALDSDHELDEERRLMYVAMTRARHHLFVVHPLAGYSSRLTAEYSIHQLSRFFDADVRDRMQRHRAAPDPQPSAVDAAPPAAPLDLRALLRGRFGG
jgi:DNA helicase-2/ATP-dependent DNA helicase PcrA